MSNEYGRFSEEQIAAWLKERSEARFFIKAFPVSVKVMDDEKRVLRVAISDERRDRDGDIVRQLGLDTSEYALNPVVFMGRGPMHANSGFPIARSLKVFRKYQGNMLTTYSDDMFAGDDQRHDEAELAYRLARDGFLNTTSIGFAPRLVRDLPDEALTDDEKAAREAGKWVRGYDIRRSIKYEHTWVGIPSNVGATVQRDLEKVGIKAGDRTVADFVEVARQFLKGAKLDTFRNALIGERELITIGAYTVEKAPAAYRDSLLKSLDESEGEPDGGFDAWEEWIGSKCPDTGDVVVTKGTPDPEPSASVVTAPAPVEDPAASAVDEVEAAAPVDPPAPTNEVERLVEEHKEAIAELTKRIGELERQKSPPPAPIDIGSLAERFEKSLLDSVAQTTKAVDEAQARTARFIEDALIELELHKDNEIFAAKRGTVASRDTTLDPATVVKDAPPPAAVATPAEAVVAKAVPVAQPTVVHIDPQMVASLVPALAKALDIEGIVEQVIYRHRGGISLSQGG